MTETIKARVILSGQIELVRGQVTDSGGELRVLHGSDYGLVTSVMYARVEPG